MPTNITIDSGNSNIRLDKYIIKNIKNISIQLIMKNLSQGLIRVNNKQVNPNYKLALNDIVSFAFPVKTKNDVPMIQDQKVKKDVSVDVVFEDDNILIANKPIALASHSDNNNEDSMLLRVQKYCLQDTDFMKKNNHFLPQLCNRLDINTSGLMIFAKNKPAHTEMNKIIASRNIHKYYLCKVFGIFEEKHDILTDYLTINEDSYGVDISKRKIDDRWVKIQTEYWTIFEERDGNSILEINLITGKKHQIRAHLAFYGHPLVGEQNYIDKSKKVPGSHQLLCAYKITFDNINSNSILEYLNKKVFELDKHLILSKMS